MKTKEEIEEEMKKLEDKYKEYQQLGINYMGNVVELATRYNTLKWVSESDKSRKGSVHETLDECKLVGIAGVNLVGIGIIFSPHTSIGFMTLVGLLLLASIDISYFYLGKYLIKKRKHVTEVKEDDEK